MALTEHCTNHLYRLQGRSWISTATNPPLADTQLLPSFNVFRTLVWKTQVVLLIYNSQSCDVRERSTTITDNHQLIASMVSIFNHLYPNHLCYVSDTFKHSLNLVFIKQIPALISGRSSIQFHCLF